VEFTVATTGSAWWEQWRKARFALAIDFEAEHHSPMRRFYLYLFMGAPTIIGIGAAVWASYNVFKALLLDQHHLFGSRIPVGALVSCLVIGLYHLRTYRMERD